MRKKKSYFKDEHESVKWFENWMNCLEVLNGKSYESIPITTSLGKTQIYAIDAARMDLPALIIFPGFRTTSLIWDLDNGLEVFKDQFRVYLIETNGQPNLSDGYSPDIKSLDYGEWGREIFDALEIDRAFIAGASFGGLVCMKISLVIPERVKAAFLLNPGCFRMISFGFKNLYANFLPIITPTRKNIRKFSDNVVFDKPAHSVSEKGEDLLIDYLEYVLKHFKDNTEKPYYMKSQLDNVQVDTHMLVGVKDILIPYEKSVANAKKHLNERLKSVTTFEAGHGIETLTECLAKVKELAMSYS